LSLVLFSHVIFPAAGTSWRIWCAELTHKWSEQRTGISSCCVLVHSMSTGKVQFTWFRNTIMPECMEIPPLRCSQTMSSQFNGLARSMYKVPWRVHKKLLLRFHSGQESAPKEEVFEVYPKGTEASVGIDLGGQMFHREQQEQVQSQGSVIAW
jgi:hypothetical protein